MAALDELPQAGSLCRNCENVFRTSVVTEIHTYGPRSEHHSAPGLRNAASYGCPICSMLLASRAYIPHRENEPMYANLSGEPRDKLLRFNFWEDLESPLLVGWFRIFRHEGMVTLFHRLLTIL
jgi:hypothetical protein